MPIPRKTEFTYWDEYSPNEMPKYWQENGQGHDQAVERGKWCVILKCDISTAKKISAWFVNEMFAIPTCTHYDGNTLSMYCGDAGGNALILKNNTETRINAVLKEK